MPTPLENLGKQDWQRLLQEWTRGSNVWTGRVNEDPANTTSVFTVQNVNWPSRVFINAFVHFLTGVNAGQTRHVSTNSFNRIGVAEPWPNVPEARDQFALVEYPVTQTRGEIIFVGVVNDNNGALTNDTTHIPFFLHNFVTNQWQNLSVQVLTSSTAPLQWASIDSNDDNTLTLDAATPLSSALENGDLVAILAFDTGTGGGGGSSPVEPVNDMEQVESTTTPLGAGATFTGTAFNTDGWGAVTVSVFADQDGTLRIEQSPDGGANWDVRDTFNYTANTRPGFEIPVVSPDARIVYVNGGAAQGTFRLFGFRRRVAGA